MARPTIFDEPMTPAERMRRYRALKRAPQPAAPKDMIEALARATRKQQAEYVGRSLRYWHHMKAFRRFSEIKWPSDVLDGKHGHVGIAFLAEVCRYGDADAQRAVRNAIRKQGAAAGRALWVRLVFDDARRTGRWELAHIVNNRLARQHATWRH